MVKSLMSHCIPEDLRSILRQHWNSNCWFCGGFGHTKNQRSSYHRTAYTRNGNRELKKQFNQLMTLVQKRLRKSAKNGTQISVAGNASCYQGAFYPEVIAANFAAVRINARAFIT